MKKRSHEPPPAAPFHAPFAGLGGRLGALPPGSSPAPASPSPAPHVPARAVVRFERKGHGGKEATVIERLGLGADEMVAWLRDLKQALGCGGVVDGETLVLQGDQRERVRELLARRGVRKISVG